MAACYRKSTNSILSKFGVDAACPGTEDSDGFSRCCFEGDVCLGSYICMSRDSPPKGGSGYYTAGCTDSSYNDTTACTPLCTSEGLPDITYVYSEELWRCCGVVNNTVSCDDPTDKTFNAPPPEMLQAALASSVAAAASSASSTLMPSMTTPTAAGATTVSQDSRESSDVQDGAIGVSAIAGITVGGVAAAALIVALAFWAVKRRRRSQARGHVDYKDQISYPSSTMSDPQHYSQYPVRGHELHSAPKFELPESSGR